MRIVVPGELIVDSPKEISYAYIDGDKTYSSVVGLFNEQELRLIPLQGPYIPIPEDVVVGVVEDVKFAGYTTDIMSPYKGFLLAKECGREQFDLGDIILAKVRNVDEVKNVDLIEPRKLTNGEIIEISPVKVPRVIGKKSSMLEMIKGATKCEIYVGKNGRIWIRGQNSATATRAILKIEKEAHTEGLTDRISAFLKEQTGDNNGQ